MDKENVVNKCTIRHYLAIKRNEILPFVTTWMNVEFLNQTDNNKYHIHGILKSTHTKTENQIPGYRD